MTISTNNSTYDKCSICFADYINNEREDTAKVVELACHHFQHIDCVALWFTENEKKGQDLSCGYCTQISMPKKESPQLSIEGLKTYFSKIERDPYQGSKGEVIRCLEELRTLSESILQLLSDIMTSTDSNCLTKTGETKFYHWIQANIQPGSQYIAVKLIADFLIGANTLRTLREEIKELSSIPTKDWSAIIPEEGVAVYDVASDGTEFRMKVSKDYLQRATKAYIHRKKHAIPDLDKIHNLGKFEEHLGYITRKYFYDSEVTDCFEDVKKLRANISNVIQSNSFLPTEKLLSLIKEMIINSEVSENSKRTIPLIINEILFDRGALRTLSEEVNRWAKHAMEEWPSQIKEGILFLGKDNSVQCCEIKDFEGLVTSALQFDKIHNAGKFEERLDTIAARYFYDPEVLDSIQDAKNLRNDISYLIYTHSSLPTEEILSLIKEMVIKSEVSDHSKRTIPLIIKEVLFERGALRTLREEVDRWKREENAQWPLGMKATGIYFLDKDNSVKHCTTKDFEKLVASKRMNDKVSSMVTYLFVGATAGFAIRNLLGVRL